MATQMSPISITIAWIKYIKTLHIQWERFAFQLLKELVKWEHTRIDSSLLHQT